MSGRTSTAVVASLALAITGVGPAAGREAADVPEAGRGPEGSAAPTLTVRPLQGVRRVVRLENDHVLVVENRYDPGTESALHTHASPRVVYVLDGGTVELISEDGSTTAIQLEPGMTIWRPAETHVVRNTGRTAVRLLETEVRSIR